MKDKLNDLIKEISDTDLDVDTNASTLYKIRRKMIKAELIFTLTKAVSLLETLECMQWKVFPYNIFL